MSRFHIHDDLTAPEACPVLRGATRRAASCRTSSACSPALPPRCARYARFRSRAAPRPPHPRRSSGSRSPSPSTGSAPGVAMHARAARAVGLALDEVALARQCESSDEREAALLRWLEALLAGGKPPMHSTRRRARPAGTTRS